MTMEVATSTPATTPAVPRTWRSLLTGRWHRSSWVVAVLVLLFLVFCNVPGQYAFVFERSTYLGVESGHVPRLVHGWPITYLVREPSVGMLLEGPTQVSCWNLSSKVEQFHWQAIAANAVLVVATAILVGALFELWRRGRRHLWQIHLRDLALLTTFIAVVVGWYAAIIRRHSHERKLLQQADIRYFLEESGGVTWLRLALPNVPFELLDPVLFLRLDVQDLENLPPLADVKVVAIEDSVTDTQLAALSRLPNLLKLHLQQLRPADDAPMIVPQRSALRLRMPPLRRLRALSYNSDFPLAGLDQLTNLEEVISIEAYLDDTMVRELAALPRLRALNTYFPEDEASVPQLSFLRRLEELTLHDVRDELLQQVRRLKQLKRLKLTGETLPGGTLHALGTLQELETLELSFLEGPVASDVQFLAALPKLRELDLSRTYVKPEIIPALARLKQLCVLSVPDHNFDEKSVERLEALLPSDCDVIATSPAPHF
ncbi:MAG TPA: hypothetical protein VMP01_12080 [Pirellulaceae bacterium]|nr:hypothetical protein [Pirellulaceae bacterium]